MTLAVDFGRTATDYGRHRAGFPDRFFDRLFADGTVADGRAVVDLGTGTGTVARGLARRGCRVTGVDRAAALMAEAARLDYEAGVSITYVEASAEATGLPSGNLDVVAAGQCWHWFDRPAAAAEAWRLLRPGGRLVIAHFDWLPLPGNIVAETEGLIDRHNPNWQMSGGTGLWPAWLADVAIAGFHDIETWSFDTAVIYSHADWIGRIRASAGVGACLAADAVTRFDEDHAAILRARFPADPVAVPHRVWTLTCRKP